MPGTAGAELSDGGVVTDKINNIASIKAKAIK